MKKSVRMISLILFAVIFLSMSIFLGIKQRGNSDGQYDGKTVSSEVSRQATVEDGSTKPTKILIVYFSLTGNTNQVANMIKDFTKGEVFEIEPDFDYSKVQSRTEMENLGKEQVKEGFQPALKNSVTDIDTYDLIIVGSPVWWFSVTPPVMSFLSQYDLAGKRVAPFCTCGSVAGDFFTQFEETIPDAEVQKGLTLTEDELKDEEEAQEKIRIWLEDLGCDLTHN